MSFQFDHWEIEDVETIAVAAAAHKAKAKAQTKAKAKAKGHAKKHVRYSNVCSVILIPSRQEYIDAGINLWYKHTDFFHPVSEGESAEQQR